MTCPVYTCTIAYTGQNIFYKVQKDTTMFIWSGCIPGLDSCLSPAVAGSEAGRVQSLEEAGLGPRGRARRVLGQHGRV